MPALRWAERLSAEFGVTLATHAPAILGVMLAGALGAAGPARAHTVDTLHVPSFGTVSIYRGEAPPRQVVLFLSGDGGWNHGVADIAERLEDAGALVVGIDVRAVIKALDASPKCGYPAGSLEELSRAVQLREKLPAYRRPILVGYSSGATLAYAALAAAPPETFAGAISLGFCPDIALRQPLCRVRGLSATRRPKGIGYDLAPFPGSTVPWMVLQGDVDQVCSPATTQQFVAATGAARVYALPKVGHGFGVQGGWLPQLLDAFHAIADAHAARVIPRASAPAVADLSLVEVPASAGSGRDEFAIVLTGDGGWADIDKNIAAGLAAAGIPVVGWSSLDYYWTPRTPDAAAADLARIVEHYASTWGKARVRVVGYSFGADVAPFLVNRLPPGARSRVADVALLGPSGTAAFEFHLASWFGGGADPALPTLPEIRRLPAPVTCIYATDEDHSVCRDLRASGRVEAVGRGHHFGGEYERIVQLMLR